MSCFGLFSNTSYAKVSSRVDIEMADFAYYTDESFFMIDGAYKKLSKRLRFTRNNLYIGGTAIRYEQIPHFTNRGSTSTLHLFADLIDDTLVQVDKVGIIYLQFENDETSKKFNRELYDRMLYVKNHALETVDKTVFRFKSFKKMLPKLLRKYK